MQGGRGQGCYPGFVRRVFGTASEATSGFLRGLGAEPVTCGEGLAGRVRVLSLAGVTAAADLMGTARC